MKHILYFIITLLVSITTTFAQGIKYKHLSNPEYKIEAPMLTYDQSIDLRALRFAHYIEVKDDSILFLSEDECHKEGYEMRQQSLSVNHEVSTVSYDFQRGPFRWLKIEYKETGVNHLSCTLQFFDLSGKMIYSAYSDNLKVQQNHEPLLEDKKRVK